MPTPKKDQTKSEWMSVCVPYLVNKEKKEQKQAVAQCLNMYHQRKKEKGSVDWEEFEKEDIYWTW